MARSLSQPLVATDFSARVLRRDQRWLAFSGLAERVSLMSFDARRMPFRDGAVRLMTTNLGLANIVQPGDLLRKLRRVVSGMFLAISHFFVEEDERNGAKIRELGLAPFLYRRSALEQFTEAGFQVELANVKSGIARSISMSELIEGAGRPPGGKAFWLETPQLRVDWHF